MAAAANDLAIRHLLLRLRPLTRALHAAAKRQAADAARLDRPDLAHVCVTDQHVSNLLTDAEGLLNPDSSRDSGPAALNARELAEEGRLRGLAERGGGLPLDALQQRLGLSSVEIDGLLLCAAVELDRRFERIISYILDDTRRTFPCVELLSYLTATTTVDRLHRRRLFGRFGRLRRMRLLESFGEATTELRLGLRLGLGVLDYLTGNAPAMVAHWRDPADAAFAPGPVAPTDSERLQKMASDLASGKLGMAGVWGRTSSEAEEAVGVIGHYSGLSMRRIALDMTREKAEEAILTAAALGSMLHFAVEEWDSLEKRVAADGLAGMLAACSVPIVLSGSEAWRPEVLLAARPYVEIELTTAPLAARRALWGKAMPGVDGGKLDELAGRFHFGNRGVQTAVRLAGAQARVESNGHPVKVEDRLESACVLMTRHRSGRFISVIKPKRGPKDLILPPELYSQVMEVARFSRALPRVAEAWGFGRLATGGMGLKALFTGDPGTGKTLAAEVIASQLGVPLLKVNVGQVVSRWVGETEKNLDEAFGEAQGSQAVLFLDEADSLCGRRGEVRHGTDRYANTEVSHLLQRLEDHDGIVILASNLRENIDPAFVRRFHVLLHFPRPAVEDRKRLWRLAFPSEAPLDSGVDLVALSRIDLTGAAIVGSARTAALLAADAGAGSIAMAHIIQGIVRQYQREGRLVTPSEFGPYATLVRSTK